MSTRRFRGGLIVLWLPIVLFLLLPLATVALTSLTGDLVNVPAAFIGRAGPLLHALHSINLSAYRRLSANPYERAALLNSIVLAAAVGVTATIFGTTLAFAVERERVPAAGLIRAVAVLLFIAPPFIGAYAFSLLGGEHGPLTRAAALVGWHVRPDFYTALGVFVVETYHATALPFLMVSPLLRRTDPQLFDAARTLGASGLLRLLRIDLPLASPGIVASGLMAAIGSFADFGTPLVLAPRNFPLLPVEAYHELVGYVDWGLAAALSCVMIACAVGLLAAYVRWAEGRHVETVGGSARLAERGRFAAHGVLSRSGGLWLTACLALLLLVPIAAYAELVIMSISDQWGPTMLPTAWTLRHLRLAFWDFPDPYLHSIVLCGSAMAACLIYGLAVALLPRRSRALDVFTTLPLIVPGTAIAIALISAYNAPPLELHQTAFIVVVALAVRRMPYAVRTLSAAKAQMDPVLGHSAATLGAAPAFATVKIFLPLLMPAIAGSAVLVFVTAITEVSSTILLAPADWTPASVHVYNLVHELALYDAAAYAIGLVALVAVLERLVRRRAFAVG
jgi:iron(III) transport system permease protein